MLHCFMWACGLVLITSVGHCAKRGSRNSYQQYEYR